MKNITNQNGRSMIEMLGVLAIVGVLSVGGIAGYSKAMQKYRTNKLVDQITQVANGVHTLYSHQKNFDGLDMQVLRKAKILPESAFNVTGSVVDAYGIHPFSGKLGLFGYMDGFRIELYDIPEDACIELLSQDWNSLGTDSYGVMGAVHSSNGQAIPMENVLLGCSMHSNNETPIYFAFKK